MSGPRFATSLPFDWISEAYSECRGGTRGDGQPTILCTGQAKASGMEHLSLTPRLRKTRPQGQLAERLSLLWGWPVTPSSVSLRNSEQTVVFP